MWAAIKARLFRRSEEESDTESAEATRPASRGTADPATVPDAPAAAPPGRNPAEEQFTEGFLGRRIREATMNDVLDDLEIVLLESDVALPVVEKIRRDLRQELGD